MGLVEGESIRDLLCRQVIVGRELRRVHSPDLVRYDDRLDTDSRTTENGLRPTRGSTPVGDMGKSRTVNCLFQIADFLSDSPNDELVEGDPLPVRPLLGLLLELRGEIQCGGCHGALYPTASSAPSHVMVVPLPPAPDSIFFRWLGNIAQSWKQIWLRRNGGSRRPGGPGLRVLTLATWL